MHTNTIINTLRGIILTTTLLLACLFSLSSCYSEKGKDHDALVMPEVDIITTQIDSVTQKHIEDSISFSSQHHYTKNFNFVVKADSIKLVTRQPEEVISQERFPEDIMLITEKDSITLYRGNDIVVAEIRILPADTIDQVWVQVARDQDSFGWIHESELLKQVVPNDPISQFISLFSDSHILWTLITVAMIIVPYTLRFLQKKKAKIIHLNDIPSFYPTLLALILALAAVVYSSIQLFEPEMWRHFYYHPTLNPLAVPPILALFLTLVWMLPIVGMATVDDVMHHLPVHDALLYLAGLAAVCMVIYVVFSVSTLYYLGYALFIAYAYFSISIFYRNKRLVYFCGNCGKAITQKGKCPHCGAINI